MSTETTLARFLQTGELLLPAEDAPPLPRDQAIRLLREHYERDRLDHAGEAPAFHPEAALWAWQKLERLARLLLDRDLGTDAIKAWSASACPAPASDPAVVYSADLSLRHVPLLARLGRQLAPSDPLLVSVHELLAAWPLSAVGCPMERMPGPEPVLAHPFLGPLYRERVLEREDLDRARHPGVQDWLLAALAPQPSLRPGFAAQVKALPATSAALSR